MVVAGHDTAALDDVDLDEVAARVSGGLGVDAGAVVRDKTFVFEVDDVECTYDKPTTIGAQIMAIAAINPSDGLVQILPDGTRKTITPEETIHLVPGAQFKRRPRFKRG